MSVRIPLFFIFSFFSLSLCAQTDAEVPCGTVGRSVFIDAYQAGKIAPVPKSGAARFVPIHLTLLGDDDGKGYADPLTVLQSLELLNEDFNKLDLHFYIDADIDYLNSSAYYDHEFSGGRDLMRNYNRTNVFNNYVVGGAAGACGYYSGSGDGVVLDLDCINGTDRTWTHEVGHYFGLPHTFFGWESVGTIKNVNAFDRPAPATLSLNGRTVQVEKVDGSNCATAADGFCDTPPDYLPERWRCDQQGVYPDSLLDPDSTRFAVPAENIMSYALDGCVESFSPEQITAMNTNLTGRIGLSRDEVPAFAAADPADVELLSPAQDETVEYSNEVTLRWNRVPNAHLYLVQLNLSLNFLGSVTTSFFTSDTSAVIRDILEPNFRYYWRVRPINRYDVSGDFSNYARFRNGATENTTSATIDAALDAAVSLGPNPVAAGNDLRLRGANTQNGKLDLRLFDASGRIVRFYPAQQVAGAWTASLPTEGLAPGFYTLRIGLNGRMVTRRLVVTP